MTMPISDYDRGRIDGRLEALREAVEALIDRAGQARNGTRARVDYVRGALLVQSLHARAGVQARQAARGAKAS